VVVIGTTLLLKEYKEYKEYKGYKGYKGYKADKASLVHREPKALRAYKA
jgi:hypothetical protein